MTIIALSLNLSAPPLPIKESKILSIFSICTNVFEKTPPAQTAPGKTPIQANHENRRAAHMGGEWRMGRESNPDNSCLLPMPVVPSTGFPIQDRPSSRTVWIKTKLPKQIKYKSQNRRITAFCQYMFAPYDRRHRGVKTRHHKNRIYQKTKSAGRWSRTTAQ